MSTPKGRELVKELVKKSDVLVENFGLGILEKWGLDWPDLQMINPRMILIRVKGMGCTGPHAADLTYGPNVGNTMATTYLWNYPGATTATAEPRTQHPDFMGGVTGAFGVVLALIQRKKTGRGQWIDNAQQEIGASLLGPRYLEYTVNKREPQARRQPQSGRLALRPVSMQRQRPLVRDRRLHAGRMGTLRRSVGKIGAQAQRQFRHPSGSACATKTNSTSG